MDALDLGTLYESLERSAAKHGDRPAYAVPPMAGRAYHPGGMEFTWTQTLMATQQQMRRYQEAGYGPGQRVAILFQQRPEFIFHFYALNALGCSVVPINPDYLHDEMVYQLEHSESCLALAIDERIDEVRSAAAALAQPIPVARFEDDGPLPLATSAAEDFRPAGTTEAALLYTSGTTGRPKGCILSNEYFHTFGLSYVSRGGLLALREGQERLYNPLPLHHANCLAIALPAMLLTGGCLVFPDRFHASTFWHDVIVCRVTALQLQGVIPSILFKLPKVPEERQHQVRFALCWGMEPVYHQPFEERTGIPVVESWTMTEIGRLITNHVEPRQIHTRAVGRPSKGLEARVVDAQDEDVPAGETGELVVRHNAEAPRKGFFSGYLKNPNATAEAWCGGWFHTGDMATRDENGIFYYVDRLKNIIRRSGENIAATEVEECLTAHQQVKQVAVMAVRDELREEEVMACVIPQSQEDAGEALAHELFEWCSARLAYFKAPGWLLFVDKLPTTSSQKLKRVGMFPPGTDPCTQPGVVDLRLLKKKSKSRNSA